MNHSSFALIFSLVLTFSSCGQVTLKNENKNEQKNADINKKELPTAQQQAIKDIAQIGNDPIITRKQKTENKRDLKLESFLLKEYSNNNLGKTRYSYSKYDLDSDGEPETFVYIENDFCGTSGCQMKILKKENGDYKVFYDLTPSKGIVFVSEEKSHNWNDLITYSVGGGDLIGHNILLKFDGDSYPKNIFVEPAKELPDGIKATRLFAGSKTFELPRKQ